MQGERNTAKEEKTVSVCIRPAEVNSRPRTQTSIPLTFAVFYGTIVLYIKWKVSCSIRVGCEDSQYDIFRPPLFGCAALTAHDT